MSTWDVAAGALLLALLPCLLLAWAARDPVTRLIGVEGASAVATMLLMALAQDWDRASYLDLPFVLALLTYGGTLVYTRFVERWL